MDQRGFTLAEGQPISDPSVSTTLPMAGGGGFTTLGDTLLLETLSHFNRERIPERVVHAKAAGAWGTFEVTNNVSSLTGAKFLSQIGKKTQVLFRLSTTGGEKGSADTVRDVRGFSVKFFTEDGNHDIVGNHIPVFFVRDPMRFPSLNRSHKRHPATNRPDPTMFWDFHVNQPESVHALMHLFGSRGLPDSIRRVTGFGVHTFKLVAPDGTFRYCKFHFRPVESPTYLSNQQGTRLAGANADFHTQDLWESISRGHFPVWKMYIQVMNPEQAEEFGRALFDITKVWSHKSFPLIEVGKMTLSKNPENYFAEIEQAAFSPSNMRDGLGTVTKNYGSDPNYVRSSLSRVVPNHPVSFVRHTERLQRDAILGPHEIPVDEEDFQQPRDLWSKVFDENEKSRWISNVSESLEGVSEELRQAVIAMFSKVEPEIGERIANQFREVSRL
ncbi:hypothetical protein N7462_001898 [Penicillium macrosclerotiorum]|uniref:uncharacterized protein n=1 Tax=Penicillium macrosclerotiorum TaxID=303699 RepID=UPI002548950D|nr:uncharacterized protein N7462_001898 [Penicillium macrosclerotiorum]KAJ5692475.1 hypothetical protein N7462_001898 [Penicillium macrosclerotiorum]